LGDAQAIENDLGNPTVAQFHHSPAFSALEERNQLLRPTAPDSTTDLAGRSPQDSHGQRFIIPLQRFASNLDQLAFGPKLQPRQRPEHCTPGISISAGLPHQFQQPVVQIGEPLTYQGQQRGAKP
jgi:hypothetical protein